MSRRDMIDLLSDILQVYNTNLLEQDASNNDVMKELQHQNKDYFEKIVKKLDEIIDLLKKQERVFYYKDKKIDSLTYLEGKNNGI